MNRKLEIGRQTSVYKIYMTVPKTNHMLETDHSDSQHDQEDPHPSKRQLLKLIKSIKENSMVSLNKISRLNHEDESNRQSICRLLKKLKNRHEARSQQPKEQKGEQAHLIPLRQRKMKHTNNSLYQQQKQHHVQNFRKSKSLIKKTLTEQNSLSIYRKEMIHRRAMEEKQEIRNNIQIQNMFRRLKQQKIREGEYLKYKEISMKALQEHLQLEKNLVFCQKRLEETQLFRQNLERQLNKTVDY